jgi:hypothetical protein
MSEWQIGRKIPHETKEKMSSSQRKKKSSLETKNNMSLSQIGKRHSQETRSKISSNVSNSFKYRSKGKAIAKNIYMWFETMTTEQINLLTVEQFCEKILSIDPNWIHAMDRFKAQFQLKCYRKRYFIKQAIKGK